MSFDKTKFTVNPQHDSEGFTTSEPQYHDYEMRKGEIVPTPWSEIPDAELNAFVDNWRNSTMVRT